MKKIFVLLFALVFIKAHSQTVDDIVTKYANAAGGLEAAVREGLPLSDTA